ncbi:MAG: 50S ribosomal protein L3 [Candidatus Gracilibacteria bacterium]|nr:50S ribosomal protein L3 [Candidatus Gracilibacteria bacterium]
MPGLLAKKLEMTRIVKEYKFIPVTLLQIPELKVVAKKTTDKEGYCSLSVGILQKGKEGIKKDGKSTLNLSEFEVIKEFIVDGNNVENYNIGDTLSIDILEGIDSVTVEGFSKGKGFAGAMKRWNFSGGPAGHGSKFHRALGSIGNRKPRRTHKGKKMHGHMGNEKVTIKNVNIEVINKELNVVGVRGGIPGGRNSLVKLILN